MFAYYLDDTFHIFQHLITHCNVFYQMPTFQLFVIIQRISDLSSESPGFTTV